MILANEFAAIEVTLDRTSNGERLRLLDVLRGGRVAYLDPMRLEALVWSDPSELDALCDPDRIITAAESDGGGGGHS